MNKVWFVGLIGGSAVLLMSGCGHFSSRADRLSANAQHRIERGTKKAVKLIHKAVNDPQRADRITMLVVRLGEQSQEVVRKRQEYRERLVELNADYDASLESFQKLIDEMHASFNQVEAGIVETRFEIKDELTAGEWDELIQHLDHGKRRTAWR